MPDGLKCRVNESDKVELKAACFSVSDIDANRQVVNYARLTSHYFAEIKL